MTACRAGDRVPAARSPHPAAPCLLHCTYHTVYKYTGDRWIGTCGHPYCTACKSRQEVYSRVPVRLKLLLNLCFKYDGRLKLSLNLHFKYCMMDMDDGRLKLSLNRYFKHDSVMDDYRTVFVHDPKRPPPHLHIFVPQFIRPLTYFELYFYNNNNNNKNIQL